VADEKLSVTRKDWPMSPSRVDAMTRRPIRIMHRRSGKNSVAMCPIRMRFSKSQ